MSLFQGDDADEQEQKYMFLGAEKSIEKDINGTNLKGVYCLSLASM